MGSSETQQSNTQPARHPAPFVIVGLATLLAVYFPMRPVLGVDKLIHPGAALLVFLLCPPLVLGYYGYSVGWSSLSGIITPVGFGVSLSWWQPPSYWVSGALVAAGYTLPVAVVMFIIGAALRRDGTVTSDRKRIALAVLLSLLLAVAVTAGSFAGFLPIGGDQ